MPCAMVSGHDFCTCGGHVHVTMVGSALPSAAEVFPYVMLVVIGVPLVRLVKRIFRGDLWPARLKAEFREGREMAEETVNGEE